MHKALGVTILIQFSQGNPILQILKTEAKEVLQPAKGPLASKCKSWKSNPSILHLLKLLTLFSVGSDSWTFAAWHPNHGHNTKENPIKVNAQCYGAAQEESSLYLGEMGKGSASWISPRQWHLTNYLKMNGPGLGKKCREEYFTGTEP